MATGKAGLSGLALAYLSIGSVLVYSGIENTTTAQTLKSLLSGKLPPAGPQNSSLGTLGASGGGLQISGSATETAVAQDALSYVRHPYDYGGDEQDPAGWDCSSFVNWVLGHDFNLVLPGGLSGYNGSTHGPVVAQYVVWTQAQRVSKSAISAGDIICYPPNVHMGIAINNTQFVSAEDPANGTQVSDIGGWLPYVAVRPDAYVTASGIVAKAKGKAVTQQ